MLSKLPQQCPVCAWPAVVQPVEDRDGVVTECERCGRYAVSGSQLRQNGHPFSDLSLEHQAMLSHEIRKRQVPGVTPTLEGDIWKNRHSPRFPSIEEQADNLLRWIARESGSPGHQASLDHGKGMAVAGAIDGPGIEFVVDHLVNSGLATQAGQQPKLLALTVRGWNRLRQLEQGAPSGTTAFMAMKFGDADLDRAFEECFKPACKDQGFDLLRLDHAPRAGLIDDRLRVEIRKARFVIADLTTDNAGAYWEAGYAEALGKDVIYTCEKGRFARGTHFDVRNQTTIAWDLADLADARSQLAATIRLTMEHRAARI